MILACLHPRLEIVPPTKDTPPPPDDFIFYKCLDCGGTMTDPPPRSSIRWPSTP